MSERQALQTMLSLWDQHCGLWAVREQVNECRAALDAEPSDEDVERIGDAIKARLTTQLLDEWEIDSAELARAAIAALRVKPPEAKCQHVNVSKYGTCEVCGHQF